MKELHKVAIAHNFFTTAHFLLFSLTSVLGILLASRGIMEGLIIAILPVMYSMHIMWQLSCETQKELKKLIKAKRGKK